jgi:Leucine-rich repeat (LRR) protein
MDEDDDLIPEPDSKGQLILSNRAWVNLDPQVWAMAMKLIKLDISYNHIVEIPSQIGELVMLREFIASYNKIEFIPPDIGKVKRLRKLILNSNRLKTIPAELGNLEILEEIVISENMLEDFPRPIARIPNLRVIKLANNRLKSLPFELADLISLEELDCGNNPNLDTVPHQWRGDTASILFICRIHRGECDFSWKYSLLLPKTIGYIYYILDYNVQMQEILLSNQDLTKHSQIVEQDNMLLKVSKDHLVPFQICLSFLPLP